MSNLPSQKQHFTEEQLQLITNTVARGATRDELNLFLYRCKEMQLNPLKPGQIYFIKYGSQATIVVGIDGFRSNAARTGKHVSTKRGVIRNEKGDIIAGTCTVRRRDGSGEIQEYTEESPFHEFNNPKNPKWQSMPETMIKKVAEAAALRMAYPDDLGGVYIEEEKDLIEKANGSESTSIRISPDQPTAEDDCPEARSGKPYTIKFGSLKHRTFDECYKIFGEEKIISSISLTKERLSTGAPYANTTLEEMNEFIKFGEIFLDSKLES